MIPGGPCYDGFRFLSEQHQLMCQVCLKPLRMSYIMGAMGTERPASIDVDDVESPPMPTAHSDPRPQLMGLALSIASGLIISINVLVATALMRLLLKRSSQSWCFVLNLALADTLVGVSITGLATEDFNSLYQNQLDLHTNSTPSTARAKSRCLLRMAFVMSPCTASILSMLLISMDRYAAIKMPLRYSLLSRKSRAVAAVLVLWISAVTLGLSPVMVKQLQSKRQYDGYCAFFSVIDEVGIIALYSCCYFPVLCLFVFIYLDILKIACSHQKQIFRVRQASFVAAERPGSQQCHHHARSFYWSHVKALRTVGVLVGCFVLLWCPFFVVSIVHILCEGCGLKGELESSLFLLGLSNSLINPLVYAFWQREVRLQLAAMFSCSPSRGGSTAGMTGRCNPPETVNHNMYATSNF